MVRFGDATWAAVIAECEACFPSEACGVVVGAGPRERFVRFDNQADRLHAADPVAFPRDARTAYVMDALRLTRLLDGAARDGDALVAIVHSHPQHRAYFSATDRAAASPFGAPTWPEASQVVVSVFDATVREVRAFRWDGGDWREAPVEGLSPLPGPPPDAPEAGEV